MGKRLLYTERAESGVWRRYLKAPWHTFGRPSGIWAFEEKTYGQVVVQCLTEDGVYLTYNITLLGAQDIHTRTRKQFKWRLATPQDWYLSRYNLKK